MLQFPILPNQTNYLEQFKKIEILSQVLAHMPIEKSLKNKVFHQQILRSALFSARIEGNTLSLIKAKDIDFDNPKDKEKREISNVLKVLNNLGKLNLEYDAKIILDIHEKIMSKLHKQAGTFRKESSAIFDQYGNVVYLTPSPEEMKMMLAVLLDRFELTLQLPWQEQLISTIACHYYFEKIHPFIDGNGRTGRVLLQLQLQQIKLQNISMFSDYILPIDKYFDENRSEYYLHLEKNSRNIDNFVEFFLQGLIVSLEELIASFKSLSVTEAESERLETVSDKNNFEVNAKDAKSINSLLPRRQEIYHIVKDHPYISFDSIARRFTDIPRRTLAYDLSQLVKLGFVNKIGKTRGVVYVVDEDFVR